MSSRAIVVLLLGVSLAAGTLVLGEHRSVSPGALSAGHARWGTDCRACHTPFTATDTGCQHCHGGLPVANAHGSLDTACGDCHVEHRGPRAVFSAASQSCTTCHAHSSIDAVAQHHEPTRARPAETIPHVLAYSHRQHFRLIERRIDDGTLPGEAGDCWRCHSIEEGFKGSRVRGDEGGSKEHALLWSGCATCHESWADVGLQSATPGTARVPFSSFIDHARLPRIRFAHSAGHLQTPCVDCHDGIPEAGPLHAGATESIVAAKRTINCFGCHAHQGSSPFSPAKRGRVLKAFAYPYSWVAGEAGAAEPTVTQQRDPPRSSITACADCHEFHGSGAHADFTAPAGEEPAPATGVLVRVAGFTITPWLLGFFGVGLTFFVFAARGLSGIRGEVMQADPDVAPQRVSEVPALSSSYESSIPGLYIVGELAGVPLINRAMKSGFDAVDAIAASAAAGPRDVEIADVVVIGAGPAGLGAATQAKSRGLSYVLCEKTTPAATIKGYPRAKIVQSAPIEIPDYGTFFQKDDESKEGLVRRWEDIIARTGLVVRENEEIVDLRREGDGVLVSVTHSGKRHRSRAVVLAIGVRGTARRLGIPGETAERVAYALSDPEAFTEREILVVGGGNAACEAALALATPALLNQVTLSHRGPVLRGVTPQNSQAIDANAREGQLSVVADSSVNEIRPRSVLLETPQGEIEVPNDFIVVMIGADLPGRFLRQIGVRMVRKGA